MKHATKLLINPDVPELKEFDKKRGNGVSSMGRSLTTITDDSKFIGGDEWFKIEDVKTIDELLKCSEVGLYTTFAEIVDVDPYCNWYYQACSNKKCNKGVDRNSKWTGYSSLFITFTCNPKWPEITRFVQKEGLRPEDRADIICRVFKMKVDELVKDLKEKKIFGEPTALVYTVEFQKRGLSHAHILLMPTCYAATNLSSPHRMIDQAPL